VSESARLLMNVFAAACGVALTYSAVSHTVNPAKFATAMRSHQIVPPRLQRPVIFTVPVVEFVTGIALLCNVAWNRPPVWPFFLSSGVLGSFVVYALLAERGSQGEDCGCGGRQFLEPLSAWTVVRAAVLLLASLGAGFIGLDTGDIAGSSGDLRLYSVLAGVGLGLLVWLLPAALAPMSSLTRLSLDAEGGR